MRVTTININATIYQLIESHHDIKPIMLELGFDNIMNPVMLNTVGRIMTIKKGAALRQIDINTIIDTFKKYHYTLEETHE